MKSLLVILCGVLCTGLMAGVVTATTLPVSDPLWWEHNDLRQLERRWLILAAPGREGDSIPPVTSAGPEEIRVESTGSPARSESDPADSNSWIRIDLSAASLFQGGQANGIFHDELAYTPASLENPDHRLRVSTGFLARLSERWTLWQRVIVDSDPALDPASRTKEFRQIDASVEIPGAVLAYERNELAAWIGRRWERWGPGWTGSLVLEPGGPAPDGFGFSWTRSRWSARTRWARLDDFPNDNQPIPRYLAGHRVDVAVTRSLRIGLSETALVTSRGSVPFWLLNPLLPWATSQAEGRDPTESTNIFWSLDAIWNPSRHWTLYGQFLLDDFMIDIEDRDTYPDQLGGLVGLLWSGNRPDDDRPYWMAGLEYSRVDTWTYVHRNPVVRYQAWSESLGHPAGPDSESATLFFGRSGSHRSRSGLIWARWHRQGQVWLNTSVKPVGSPGLPWPTEPVSRWWQFGATLEFHPLSGLTSTLRGGWTDSRPGTLVNDLQPNPSSIQTAHGFWASLTLTLPLLRIVSDL